MTNINTPENEPAIEPHVEAYETDVQADVRKSLEKVREHFRNRIDEELDIDALVTDYEAGEAQDNIKQSIEEYRDELKAHYASIQNSESSAVASQPTTKLGKAGAATKSIFQVDVGDTMKKAASFADKTAIPVIAGTELGLGLAAGSTLGTSLLSAGVITGGLAGLYGLGRLHGKLWDSEEKEGVFRNLLRGAVSPVTVPAAILTKSGSKTWGNNKDAAGKMVSGESFPVKAVSSPIWWPARSVYRMSSGVLSGVRGTSTFSETKGMGKVGHAVGKVIRSPYSALKWLFERSGSNATN